MIVLKRGHYILALLVLFLVVFLAMRQNADTGETPSESVLAPVSSKAATSSASEPEASAAQAEKVIGVWIPYMSLVTEEKGKAAFLQNYQQKLQDAKSMGANAVFVHVRPFADSFYPSAYEPWSHLLTGTQGKDPGYDPLDEMIRAAHALQLSFHAWVNPLRISTTQTPGVFAEDGFYLQNRTTHPEYFLHCASGIYYNPASPLIRQRIALSTAEIAQRYDVDGIHFDDYFYPAEDPEMDRMQYEAYRESVEEPLSQPDWRTANINDLIATVYRRIKLADASVCFGISPQGNLQNNELINADVRTWCSNEGYIDYICPQLYFSLDHPTLPFETALQEWTALDRPASVQMYVGLALYKAGTDADSGTWKTKQDILARQIQQAAYTDGILLYAVDHIRAENAAAEVMHARAAIQQWKKMTEKNGRA